MAVLNVRIEDDMYQHLRGLADAEEQTLSEYVRDLLLGVVVPVADRLEHGDQPAPESFSVRDRIILSTLHRILARVLPEDANGEDGDEAYQLKKAEILESGFTREYWLEVAGYETELSNQDCERVVDILQMFRIITYSVDRLARDGQPIDDDLVRQLQFSGFDHNDALEGHMARYVRFQMSDERRWAELRPQVEKSDSGNSHMPMLAIYLRMLTEYRRIMKGRERIYTSDAYFLSAEDLSSIESAAVHPSRRS